MKSTLFWALAALNVLLLGLFISRMTHENIAQAQARRSSDYLMIVGDVTGSANQVVHIMDTTTGMLSALSYDDSTKRLDAMVPVELSRVLETAPANTSPQTMRSPRCANSDFNVEDAAFQDVRPQ